MKNLEPEKFLEALFDSISEAVKENKVTHPEDVMSLVLTHTEAVYGLISRLPTGYRIGTHEK